MQSRTEEELKLFRKSGQIAARAMKKVIENVRVGITLKELDEIAENEIQRLGGRSSFKTVPGYYWTTCLTINDEVVHGIPRDIELKDGDVLGIDLGAVYEGWHSDMAWSVIVRASEYQSIGISENSDTPTLRDAGTLKEKEKFLKVGEEILWKAIAQAVEGKKIGDISSVIQQGVEGAGYSVVKSLAGHGVGREAHEDPEIPEYGTAGKGLILRTGMTLAIEVIYAEGRGEVYETDDGWTISTKDGSLGGLFEMSVIVGKKKPEITTDWRGL